MKLFNELPTILPFYTDIKNQDRFKENVRRNCPIQLFSPKDAFLPFTLKLPKDSPKPTSWKVYDQNDTEVIDLTNNIGLLKAFNFEDFSFAYYNGEKLTFEHETISQDLNLVGRHYFVLEIGGVKYYSEVFQMCSEITTAGFSDRFVKIVFWDEKDIDPIRYRNNFKQVVYFDTFIHESDPQIEEDNETDGFGNKIPTFQKLVVRQNIEVVVSDFMKIAMLTLQMHDFVEVYEKNKRSGKVDRTIVTGTSEDNGSFSTIELKFETDILVKSSCEENKPIISEIWL